MRERARARRLLCTLPNRAPTRSHAGVAMWSRLLLLAFLLSPAPALAGPKEKAAALAPSGLVLVVDADGNELVAQNADEPFVPASVTKIVTAWLALEVLGAGLPLQNPLLPGRRPGADLARGRRSLPGSRRAGPATAPAGGPGRKAPATRHRARREQLPGRSRIPGIEDSNEAYDALNSA